MDAGKTYVTFVAVVFMSYNCLFYFNKTNIGVLASLPLETCNYNLCIAKKDSNLYFLNKYRQPAVTVKL